MKFHAMMVLSGTESPNRFVFEWIIKNRFPTDRTFRCTVCLRHITYRKHHISVRHKDLIKTMTVNEALDKYFPKVPDHISRLLASSTSGGLMKIDDQIPNKANIQNSRFSSVIRLPTNIMEVRELQKGIPPANNLLAGCVAKYLKPMKTQMKL